MVGVKGNHAITCSLVLVAKVGRPVGSGQSSGSKDPPSVAWAKGVLMTMTALLEAVGLARGGQGGCCRGPKA